MSKDDSTGLIIAGIGGAATIGLLTVYNSIKNRFTSKNNNNNMSFVISERSQIKLPARWNSRSGTLSVFERASKQNANIKFASELYNVPEGIIRAFMMVESDGKPDAVSFANKVDADGKKAIIGLMQFNYTYIDKQMMSEASKGRVNDAIRDYFRKEGYEISSTSGLTPNLTRSDAIAPRMNTVLGAMLLRRLMDGIVGNAQGDWATDTDGTVRLDRVAVCYNAGAFGALGKKARLDNLSFLELRSRVGSVSQYIDLLYAPDGALEVNGVFKT